MWSMPGGTKFHHRALCLLCSSKVQERSLQPHNSLVLFEKSRRDEEQQLYGLQCLRSDAGSFSCLLHPQHCFVLNYKCKMGTSRGSCSFHLLPPPQPCHHRRYLNLSPVTRKNQAVIISLQHTPSAEPFQTAMTGIKTMKKTPRDGELHKADTLLRPGFL